MASLLSPSSPALVLQPGTDLCVIGDSLAVIKIGHRVNGVRNGTRVISTQPLPVLQLSNERCGSSRSYRNRVVMRKVATSSVQGDVIEKNESTSSGEKLDYGVVAMHHVGILCENLERSLEFYQNILGLEINEGRPDDKLPYRGAWLWVGSEMIHLMELPNPDPLTGRPEHGGRDRHTCISIRDVSKLRVILDRAGIAYTLSKSGRPAIFTRDPDANALEFTQVDDA